MLSIIATIGQNREIGKDNDLLWHVPGDLPRFKQITTGHPIIMGRKTFESIGRVLPERTNIVITTDKNLTIPGAMVVGTLEEALDTASKSEGREEIFVIGGGVVYKQTIDLADRLYLTIVEKKSEADTFFPQYSDFKKVIAEEVKSEAGMNFKYLTLERL